jgi:hypothetical protein
MRLRAAWMCTMAALAALSMAGCGASSTTNGLRAATSTAVPTVAPTATASATATPVMQTFTCPAATNGQYKVFADQQTGLTFRYPAAWTETQCTRLVEANGTIDLRIANLFSVSVVPRQGLSIQWWVNQQSDQNETVTLGALQVMHAVEAATVVVTVPQGVEYDREPFNSTIAIVAGSSSFYQVVHFIETVDTTDTVPPLSIQQQTQQIVSTFDVP